MEPVTDKHTYTNGFHIFMFSQQIKLFTYRDIQQMLHEKTYKKRDK